MADIDKALPNEPRKTVNVPGEEEIQEQLVEAVEAQQEAPGPVETIENEDGSKLVQLPDQDQFTIGELVDKLGVKLAEFMAAILKKGLLLNVNSEVDQNMAKEIAQDLNILLEFESEDVYTQKLNILKESFVGAPEQNEEILQEASEPVEQALSETYGSSMASYVNALGRSLRN